MVKCQSTRRRCWGPAQPVQGGRRSSGARGPAGGPLQLARTGPLHWSPVALPAHVSGARARQGEARLRPVPSCSGTFQALEVAGSQLAPDPPTGHSWSNLDPKNIFVLVPTSRTASRKSMHGSSATLLAPATGTSACMLCRHGMMTDLSTNTVHAGSSSSPGARQHPNATVRST